MRQLLYFLFSLIAAPCLMAQDYAADYATIDSLMREGQFRSALTAADSVYRRAEAAGDRDDIIKALGYRASFTSALEEDGRDAALTLLRTELAANANRPIIAGLLHLMLGELYHAYGQDNAYRLNDATELATDTSGSDAPLASYSLGRLRDAAHFHLYRALELAENERTALAEIPAIVANATARAAELPTLYDLILVRAMDVLNSPLGSITDQRPGELEPLLAPASDFATLDLTTRFDTTQGTPRKLQLFQRWLAYHLPGGPSPALLQVDLRRIDFVASLGASDSLHFTTLEALYAAYAGVATRDRILVAMARVLENSTDMGELPLPRALALLDRVGTNDAVAQREAAALRRNITTTELDVIAHNVYPRNQPLLVKLDYRNTERVYYAIYPNDPLEEAGSRRRGNQLADILSRRRLRNGNQRLAANDDYHEHSTELMLEELPVGGYYLVVGTERDLADAESTKSAFPFQVSDLGITKVNEGTDQYVQISDRTTGAARTGVRVNVRQSTDRDTYRSVARAETDQRGTFTLPGGERFRNYQLILEDPATDDRLVGETYHYNNRESRNRKQRYTTLLTDRSIYRPGQTVRVYGLRYELDPDQMPSVVSDDQQTVILRDANYQEVAQRDVRSDRYGRFHLDFTLPTGGLTGDFHLQTENGNLSFRVEEYKRPRFRVELEQPAAVVPGAVVEVTGTATTYAGPAVADARVNYRVFLEEVNYYYFFRGGGRSGDRSLVSSGSTTTDAEGKLSLTVTTRADVVATRYRRLRYVVEADVADATGETHAATTSFGIRADQPVVNLQAVGGPIDAGDTLALQFTSPDQDTTVEITLRIVPVTKPNAAPVNRHWSIPDRPVIPRATFERAFPQLAYAPVPEVEDWPTRGDAVVTDRKVRVENGQGTLRLPADFAVGHYRVEWSYADGTAGGPVSFGVMDVAAGELPAGVAYHLAGPDGPVRVGEPATLTLVTATDVPLLFAQWTSRRGTEFLRERSDGRRTFTYTPTEADRGGIIFQLAFVRWNRTYEDRRRLELGWDNKDLKITYATFRDRLRPGEPERWTVNIARADGQPVAAAALATMYDASLDQIASGRPWNFSPYPQFYGVRQLVEGSGFGFSTGRTYRPNRQRLPDAAPALPSLDLGAWDPRDALHAVRGRVMGVAVESKMMRSAAPQNYSVAAPEMEEQSLDEVTVSAASAAPPPPPPPPVGSADGNAPAPPQIRKNLQETAFWLPELTAGQDGSLDISFTSPEALTAWQFRLFTHDTELNYALSERRIVTQKELMILPNVPRFLREGDEIELTARVSNTTDSDMQVDVDLELFDPRTEELIDPVALLGGAAGAVEMRKRQQLTAGGSATVRFPLIVPEGLALNGPLGYRLIARSETFSDGEENIIPVLTDRTLVTVGKPFYLKRKDTKTIELPALAGADSPSLRHVGYTFEATTNPAWLALKALPYLIEYPYDCTEQVANRFFANQLAYATVSTKPVLQEVFTKWQADSNALRSELERNPTLKNALLTETPWVREAQSEAEQRARIGELFQLGRLAAGQEEALAKLERRQEQNGAYSWFPGGYADRYMTQYVVETLGRLRQLGVLNDDQRARTEKIATATISYLDGEMAEVYDRLFRDADDKDKLRQEHRPSSYIVHYLYARRMSGAAAPRAQREREAVDFFRRRAYASWLSYDLYEQALIALAARDDQATDVAGKIITSLRERAIHHDEFGMYWKYGQGYRWNNLPIETHTRLIEAFTANGGTQDELDEMRLWLLTNKRTNRWPTTKATAAAVYAILNAGERYVAREDGNALRVEWPDAADLGDRLADRVGTAQETAEAASGQFLISVPAEEVGPGLARVKVRNRENDLVWGSVYWQYTELAERVEANNDGPLQLKRELYRKVATDAGLRLEAITEDEPLRPGDRITVRLVVTSDRDLDYVHLKDRRAASFEPVDALSEYKSAGGLGYYFAPGDLATNFFIADLPRGTYTLEYDLFATYAGSFSNGLGRVQCMYAPEFGANSAGGRVRVVR